MGDNEVRDGKGKLEKRRKEQKIRNQRNENKPRRVEFSSVFVYNYIDMGVECTTVRRS